MKTSFREISPAEFSEFADACPVKSYMQSSPMAHRYSTIGREHYLLGLYHGDKLVVAGLASNIYERFGRKIFTFSRGPLTDFSSANLNYLTAFLEEAKKFLKSRHGIILQISPSVLVGAVPTDFARILARHGFKYLGEYEQVKWTYALDFASVPGLPPVSLRSHTAKDILAPAIDSTSEQILSRHFRRDHRYTIKYATSRYGIKLRILPVSEYATLLALLNESGREHGFVPRDQKFFEQMSDAFHDDVVAIVAEYTPEEAATPIPIAAAFFILYGDEVIYLSSGLARAYKKLGGPHLIQSAMLKFAYAHGYRQYNFWGTDTASDNGVYKFKQGFHGEVEEFVGTFAAPLSPLGSLYLHKIHPAEHRDLG